MIEGLLGRKIGMTQVYREDGSVVGVTAIEAGPCIVTQVKTPESDGYTAVQVGFGHKRRLNGPERGHAKGLGNFRWLREFKMLGDDLLPQVGEKIDASLFEAGDRVDVVGISKGKGFAGGVKRHHFRGGPKTHGQSDRHRAPGSIGAGTTPGRVLKGTRMAGHMGAERVTVPNLEIVASDPARNLILIHGAVPGGKNGLVMIKRARKSRIEG
ncbi:MAG TPA: 50S ribosomal protein L3 [Dehalococcoidia bacterium]|nr:50S ribosomal protein L3 [Dehalococcoidia bacterium]